jgi:hypothetical protein
MQEGDVIVQQAFLPPLPLSVKCVFAVRVLQIFCEPAKVGFSYGTLRGHAEMGRSEFSFALRDGVIYSAAWCVSLPGRRHGLVQPVCAVFFGTLQSMRVNVDFHPALSVPSKISQYCHRPEVLP